eukprot:CAMPEP_0175081234 /NCGR_PEP_ID=MMETSP0052_2-20121109/26017_1 /TAXON_ID=51329 ORGANISM="Polytomella parva, Strain SAG 63-3" /NCGR_SAMPLE_ID=MMETSP0052_2 /ASSEMBLY_ACC=CAM_ASM_000194 /LENGTH=117 /DNA_ID=CAMNT_0016352157 /DNA_START=41 /DNA_END=395 /DNA_ORIENTATION=-
MAITSNSQTAPFPPSNWRKELPRPSCDDPITPFEADAPQSGAGGAAEEPTAEENAVQNVLDSDSCRTGSNGRGLMRGLSGCSNRSVEGRKKGGRSSDMTGQGLSHERPQGQEGGARG